MAVDPRYVTHSKWEGLTATELTYPSGRQVSSGYDALYRRKTVNETLGGASIAAWQFFGARTATVALGNGIVCSMMNNGGSNSAVQDPSPTNPAWNSGLSADRLGYDGSGRLIAKRFLPGGTTPASIGSTTGYDASSNKLFERMIQGDESRSALYPSYDSMDRLVEYQRGILNSGGGSISTDISLPGTDSDRTYNLDGLGNWSTTVYTPEGGSSTTETRTHNPLNEITAFGVYPASTSVLYDHGNNTGTSFPNRGNGNIADDGTRTYAYDALNRLTTVTRKSDSAPVAAYTYDALGRRAGKVVTNGGIPGGIANTTYRYLYDGQQIVEELLFASSTYTTLRQFIWGRYIDELVQLKVPATTTAPPLTAGTYYPLQDLLYRTIATTDSSGAIVEAYDYDAYGNTLMFNAAGSGSDWWADDATPTDQPMCQFLFTGRQYDPETQIYWYRARYYHPMLGRFVGRDPIYKRVVNLYLALESSPVIYTDALGMQASTQPSGSSNDPNAPITVGTSGQTGATWETANDWINAYVNHDWWSGTKLDGPVSWDCTQDANGCYVCNISNHILTWFHALQSNDLNNGALQGAIKKFNKDARAHEDKVLAALNELIAQQYGPYCCPVNIDDLKKSLTQMWRDLWQQTVADIEKEDRQNLHNDLQDVKNEYNKAQQEH